MANAYNVCGWGKRVTATMGIPAIFLHDEGAKWGFGGCFLCFGLVVMIFAKSVPFFGVG